MKTSKLQNFNPLKLTILFLVLSILNSCSSDNDYDKTNSYDNTSTIIKTENLDEAIPNESSFNANEASSKKWPIIKIAFLKVPKFGSLECSFGFGFCFSIVLAIDEIQNPEIVTNYNESTGEVEFTPELINENTLRLHFPSEITNSDYHSSNDLENFIVTKNTQHGEVMFIEGSYPTRIDENGNLICDINIEI